jgi:hypothetical protein
MAEVTAAPKRWLTSCCDLTLARSQEVAAAMQVPPEGRIPLDRAIRILSFKKASSKKDLDRISRILDPGAIGSILPSQLVCLVPL